jgi:hypothetical protein
MSRPECPALTAPVEAMGEIVQSLRDDGEDVWTLHRQTA